MSSFPLFCSQKWKIRVFAILVEKGCPKRYVNKGFCASGESEWKSLFSFFHMTSCFYVAQGITFLCFFFSEQQLFHKKSSFSPRAPNSGKHKHLGTFLEPKVAQDRFSALFAVKTAKSAQNAFWTQKCGILQKWVLFCSGGVHFAPIAQTLL